MWNNHRYPHVYVGDCDHVQPLVGAGTRTRSQTGLRFHKPNATVCVIKWIWQIRKRWSLHKTNNIVNINYIHTYRELSYSQNDLITAARARARFQKRSDHCEKVIGSLISRPLTISRSDRIPRTILLWSDHDPGRSCSRLGSVLDQKFHHNNWSFYQ